MALFLAARDAEHERRFAERGNELDLARQERDEAQRAVAELRTVQGAWHSVFGSSQLTHASDNFESAKSRAERAEATLQDMTQQRDEFRTEANSSADLLNEALEKLAVVTKERDDARLLSYHDDNDQRCQMLMRQRDEARIGLAKLTATVDDEELASAMSRGDCLEMQCQWRQNVLIRAIWSKTAALKYLEDIKSCEAHEASDVCAWEPLARKHWAALKESEAKITRYEVRARESAHDASVLRARIAAMEKKA